MMSGARVLAVWFAPALWLSMPALIVERGPDGLWIALALALAPLIALGAGSPRPASDEAEPVFPVIVLLVAIGVLLWANLTLAGDVAAWLGAPRWQGVAVTAAGGCLLTAWRGGAPLVPALLLAAALALSAPLAEVARAAGVGPIGAWAHVAGQTAFRFPSTSPWVTDGRDPRLRGLLVFEEEQRIIAPDGGRLLARTPEGGSVTDVEWMLTPGQSVTLRAGDGLRPNPVPRLRFEPDKRVPGAPASGIDWAAGAPADWPRRAGVLVTLVFGALGLCRAGAPWPTTRATAAVAAGGGLLVLAWAQGWALYSILASPDLFLGGITPERFLALPAMRVDEPVRAALEGLLLAGGMAGFLASSTALRERLGALDRTGGGEIGRDLGLWAGVFTIAALASLWPLDAWSLTLCALGAAGSGLGTTALGSTAAPPGVDTVAGLTGLALFGILTAAAQVLAPGDGLLGAMLAYPALAAVPAACLVSVLGRATTSHRPVRSIRA